MTPRLTPESPEKTLAQVAFEAHRDYLGGVRPWSGTRKPERELWEVTVAAVIGAMRTAGYRPSSPDSPTT